MMAAEAQEGGVPPPPHHRSDPPGRHRCPLHPEGGNRGEAGSGSVGVPNQQMRCIHWKTVGKNSELDSHLLLDARWLIFRLLQIFGSSKNIKKSDI